MHFRTLLYRYATGWILIAVLALGSAVLTLYGRHLARHDDSDVADLGPDAAGSYGPNWFASG